MVIDQQSLFSLRRIVDFIFLNISFLLAAYLAQPLTELFSNELLFILLLLQNILWLSVSNIGNTYTDFNYRSFSDQLFNLSRIVIAEVLFTIFFLFFVKEDLFTRNFVLFFGLILTFTVFIKEYLLWSSLNRQRLKGKYLRNLLIVGHNEISEEFKSEIEDSPEFGFKFVGFFDSKEKIPDLNKKAELLEKKLVDKNVRDVVYADSLDDVEFLNKVRAVCDKLAIKLTLLPQINQFSNSNVEINFFGNFPVLTFRNNRLEQYQWRFVKRSFDIVFTLVAFVIILWWVYLIIGVIIKLTSKGKALFNQQRIGRDGTHFRCYKFRTMRGVSEKHKSKVVDESDRITAIGRFLRKFSLDELPQFINVLKGDMSIVGPRPHAIYFNELYSDMVEEIKLRHRVKPGITGWAQIHGLRGDVFDFEENKLRTKKRIDFDNWYIENWSLKLDVKIIIETVWQIISGRNLGT